MIEEEIARELYRCLYPGSVNTPDSARTPESDAAEFDRAYETWDAGREGWAPGIRCRESAARLMPLVRRAQAEALRDAAKALEATTEFLDPDRRTDLSYINCTAMDVRQLLIRADRIESEGAGA